MNLPFEANLLPRNSVLITCSSHEERCLALPKRWGHWRPLKIVLFHYDDPNPRRERNHAALRRLYGNAAETIEIEFTEKNAVGSFKKNHKHLVALREEFLECAVVMDISVMTKRHLLMMLQWLDDIGCFSRLHLIYSEPAEYRVTEHMPLSFGVSKVEEVPGFAATPDASRPLHVVIFLGYEGDRTLATYEILQPMRTTLVIPDPPFREEWRGRTEDFNRDLIAILGDSVIRKSSAIDPADTYELLEEVLGPQDGRAEFSKIVCPLGTKPQTVGVYMYTRRAVDPPAVVYTGPLRHNHAHFSEGIGNTWIILRPL
jgi:hypothetical protein